MEGRLLRPGFGLALVAVPALVFSAAAQAHHTERFQLFGTASIDKDPTDRANQVLEIDTTEPGSFGVFREVNEKITSLDDHLSVMYYFVGPKSCNLGSPRIQLRVDLNGDGMGDGNAFGHIGPSPFFTECTPNQWIPEDLTISMLENAVQAHGPLGHRPAGRVGVHQLGQRQDTHQYVPKSPGTEGHARRRSGRFGGDHLLRRRHDRALHVLGSSETTGN